MLVEAGRWIEVYRGTSVRLGGKLVCVWGGGGVCGGVNPAQVIYNLPQASQECTMYSFLCLV